MTAGAHFSCSCYVVRDMVESPDLLLQFGLCHSHARDEKVRVAALALREAMLDALDRLPPRLATTDEQSGL